MSLIRYFVFHPWRAATVVIVGILLGTAAFYVYELTTAFGVVASEDFDPDAARDAIEADPPGVAPTTIYDFESEDLPFSDEDEQEVIEETLGLTVDPRDVFPSAFGDPIPDEVFDSYLLLGTDASGYLTDAIILALQPTDGGTPVMVSLPRDLWVWNLCKGRFSRLNEGLIGCSGTASGSELMAIMVEDYTGIPVDHLARINFGGFARMVDVMGGITVCVEHPTRDEKAQLEIATAGCQTVNGDTALAWVRSRRPEVFRDEEWVQAAGSDFARQTKQQDVLFQLAAKAAAFSSPTTLADKLSAVASSVRLDSSWSFGEAVSAGWRYRGISKDSVDRFSIRVRNYRTSGGAAVLVPTVPFRDQLGTVYPLPSR